jgi:excisionase family DNA binding protein
MSDRETTDSEIIWHLRRQRREDAMHVDVEHETPTSEAPPAVAGVFERRRARDAEYPLTVREAARFLGVSPQTVYLWVERKQIPHLRVMGRNIRFLKSDLEPFRNRFKQEVEDGTTT